MSATYTISGSSLAGGEGTLVVFGQALRFDASAEGDQIHPGPAELLCASLAACLLKNVERFSGILPFRYTSAQAWVEADREDKPPRFVRFRYRVEVVTDEPERQVELLHRNVRQFGTVSGTLGLAVPVEGTLTAVRAPSMRTSALDVSAVSTGEPMMTVRVFDPALCCATGVCGPTVDPELARFAGDVAWLKARGVSVERFNLSQQPGAFVEPAVKAALEALGEAALPLVQLGGATIATGHYPSRAVLAKLAGVPLEDEAPKASPCCGPKASATP